MKKTLLTIAIVMMACICSYGQDNKKSQSYTREGDTFVQSTKTAKESMDQVTAYKWRDKDGNEYPIILHTYQKGEKAGRTTAYVIRTSAKTGKEYKYYLPNGEEIADEILKENQ